jgi:hypothetical protein
MAPGVVRREVVGVPVVAVLLGQDRRQRLTRHVRVEEVPKAVAPPVLAGGVVGVGERAHEDHALLLGEILLRDRDRAARAAAEHDDPVALDHAARAGASRIRLGLGIAGDVFDLHAEQAVALERGGLERLEHAAALVQVLDGELERAQLVGALVGIGAGLGHVEAEHHLRALDREVADRLLVRRPGVAHEVPGRPPAQAERADAGGRRGRGPDETSPADPPVAVDSIGIVLGHPRISQCLPHSQASPER